MSFRPPDSPYYYAEYVDALGKRRRVSSKKKTKREGDAFEADLRSRVQRQRHGLEPIERNPGKLTLRQAAEWCIEHVYSKQAGAAELAGTIRKHICNGTLGDLPLEHVTPALITAWLSSKIEEE